MPYGEPYLPPPPPYGGGMPPSPYAPPPPMMPPSGPGYGPPPGGMMMPPPQPGLGDPVGFLLPGLFKAIGSIFGGGSRPPPPPPTAAMPMRLPPLPGQPPLPQLFYTNRPEFCRVFCPPMPGAMPSGAGGGVRRGRRGRRRRLQGLGEPVGALPLLAALAPMALQILPGLIQGLTKGGGLSGYGYYGEPPESPYAGW